MDAWLLKSQASKFQSCRFRTVATLFLIRKRALFRKVKPVKHVSGGGVLYAAQTYVKTDAEIAEKGRFRAEISGLRERHHPQRFSQLHSGWPWWYHQEWSSPKHRELHRTQQPAERRQGSSVHK